MKRFKDIVTGFVNSPGSMVVLFVSILLVPNAVLAVTEPYRFTTIAALFLIPAGFYLFWLVTIKRTGIMMLCLLPFIVLAAFQLVISYLFGNSIIAADMFTNLFTTSASEAGELLGTIYPSIILVCVLYIPLLAVACYYIIRGIRMAAFQQRRLALTGLLFLIAGGMMAGISKYRNSRFGIKYHIFPVNVCYNIKLSVERWERSMDYRNTSGNFCFNAAKQWDTGRREVYVMVIGEASRACSWSLYGYGRETNPKLSGIKNLVLFKDMLTQSNTTHKSVPILLSSVGAERIDSIYKVKGLPALFSEAGFRTVFISNQPANHSLIDFFAGQADTVIDITSHDKLLNAGHHHDGEVVPHVGRMVAATEDNLFIIIHTYGSHARYTKRYPPSSARFVPDEITSINKKSRDRIVNAYDNSILYTDMLLSEIISVLDSAKICSAMFYCSDHGEDLLDDSRMRYLHASPTATYYQLHVPGFIWFSDNYIDRFPAKYEAALANTEAAASTASVFHTLGDLASIRCRYIIPSHSLVSDRWVDTKRMYLNDYNVAVHFLDTGLTPYDMELLDRHSIKYDKEDVLKICY